MAPAIRRWWPRIFGWSSGSRLPFDDDCAAQHALVRLELKRRGAPIGSNDLMIAATALAHNLTLITHNVKEFSRVPGLLFEDWRQ